MSGFPRIFAEGLAAQLSANIAGLAAAYAEWPEKNQQLVYPSMTVCSVNPVYTRCNPYIIQQGTETGNKATDLYVVGEFEIGAQIDIWTRHKVERDTFYGLLFNLLETTDSAGFRFQLPNWFGEYVSIWQTGYKLMDNEDSVTRKEWRAMVSIGALCRAVNTVSEFIITQPPVLTLNADSTTIIT